MKIFKVLIFAFTFLVISCNKDEIVAETVIENQFNINNDGVEYQSINNAINGNENCDILYIQASYYDKNKTDFTVKFQISTEGQLINVWYDEYTLPFNTAQAKKIFLTPTFNPLSAFTISNFYYDATSGEVKFDFNGTVYFEKNNNIKKNIFGKLKIKALKSFECSFSKNHISYKSPNLKLFSFSNNSSKYSNQTQTHRFFFNNGFKIYLQFPTDLWLYPLGEINFNENSTTNKVEFKRAIAPFMADQIQRIDDQKWQNYQTSGKIIIERKYIAKNKKVISGKIDLVVKDNGIIVYNLNGIKFQTGSFEN